MPTTRQFLRSGTCPLGARRRAFRCRPMRSSSTATECTWRSSITTMRRSARYRVTRNLGTPVEVDSGIKAGDRVILNPPVTLIDGSKVQVRPEADGQRHADLQ